MIKPFALCEALVGPAFSQWLKRTGYSDLHIFNLYNFCNVRRIIC